MTEKGLKEIFLGYRIDGNGYVVGFAKKGQKYFARTKNLKAIERLEMEPYPKRLYEHEYVTKKQALIALHEEVIG